MPNEIQFTYEPFWVQLHNLQFAGMTREVGELIGLAICNVLKVDLDHEVIGWGKFLRIRVGIDFSKRLALGRLLNIGGKQVWVNFKREILPKLCFKCCILKHKDRKCPEHNSDPQALEQYGQWMHAALILYSRMVAKKYDDTSKSTSQASH